MALIKLSQISKSYGAESILSAVTFQLQAGEKAGLIGPNGSGKTTLLKIITGEIEADQGTNSLARGAKIGYLSQEPAVIPSGTLRSHLEYPLRHLIALKEEMASLEAEISTAAGLDNSLMEDCLERYAALTARFEDGGGYQFESRLTGVARGLGFELEDLDREIEGFSGGEKTRARLAGLLLQEFDLLLLDEPTNFLDLQALQWLEKYLRDLNSAQLIVSHDRYFLDRLVSRIFTLKAHQLKSYSGNYSSYREQLEKDELSSGREYHQLQLLKAREERLVREAKGDERSKRQARSRQKRLDKLEPVERLENDQSFKLGLDYSGRSGSQVIIFDRVTMTFENRDLFKDLSFEIRWGDRIALIGPNGAGKSTMLKIISGSLKPGGGRVRLGPSVKMLYFDQEQEKLVSKRTLLETITDSSEFDLKQARNHLARYLFRGDDVFKKVADLSGGEKSRLALACLSLGSGNCLLMDEPTSHLDLPAVEELEKVLSAYPGTLMIVSHDRYFLKKLANRVFELDGGGLSIHERSFEEYLEAKEEGGREELKKKGDRGKEKNERQSEHQKRQAEQKIKRRLANEQKRLEQEIVEAEEEIANLELTLSNPQEYGDRNRLAELGRSLESVRDKLNMLLARWEDVTAQLEDIMEH